MIFEEIKEILEKNVPIKEESYWKDILGIKFKEGNASAQYCCFLFMGALFEDGCIVVDESKNTNVVAFKYKDGGYLITKINEDIFKGLEYSDLENIKVLVEKLN